MVSRQLLGHCFVITRQFWIVARLFWIITRALYLFDRVFADSC